MANRYTKFGGSGGGPPFSGCLVEIPIGTYFLRLGCLGDCGPGWSVNFDPVSGLRDDPAKFGYVEQFDPLQGKANGSLISATGVANSWVRGGTLYSRTWQIEFTNDVARQPVDDISLRDRAFGFSGEASVIVRFRGYALTVPGGGYTILATIGIDAIPLLTIPASTGAAFEVELHIGYDTTLARPYYAARGFLDGVLPKITAQNGSFDPTAPQTLEISVQALDLGDLIDCNSCVAVQENTDFCHPFS